MALGRDVTITWYGHACVEVRTPGDKVVLFDPWFGNPLSPRTRGFGRSLRPDAGDPRSRRSPRRVRSRSPAGCGPAWPCIHEMSLWLGRRLSGGSDAVIGMNKGGTVEVAGLRVTMTGADHSSGDWNAAGDTTVYLGEPAGFVLELEDGFRVYHAGDTNVFGDMRLIGELYQPGPRAPADRRALHDGSARGRPRGRAARRPPRHADPLRHVPDPDRDAGPVPGGTGRPRAGRCRDPRAAPRAARSNDLRAVGSRDRRPRPIVAR